MTSRTHKMLVDMIARKIRLKGYTIVALEGSLLNYSEDEKIPLPLTIKRHRPDIIGINLRTKRLCIGEAKSADDLFSRRTINQFSDFSQVIGTSGEKAELILGVPQRSLDSLSALLKKMDLPMENISIVFLPEELVDDDFQENSL